MLIQYSPAQTQCHQPGPPCPTPPAHPHKGHHQEWPGDRSAQTPTEQLRAESLSPFLSGYALADLSLGGLLASPGVPLLLHVGHFATSDGQNRLTEKPVAEHLTFHIALSSVRLFNFRLATNGRGSPSWDSSP